MLLSVAKSSLEVEQVLIDGGFSLPSNDPNVLAVNGGYSVYSSDRYYVRVKLYKDAERHPHYSIIFSHRFRSASPRRSFEIVCDADNMTLLHASDTFNGAYRSMSFYRSESLVRFEFLKYDDRGHLITHRLRSDGPAILSYKIGSSDSLDLYASTYVQNDFILKKRGYFFTAPNKKIGRPNFASIIDGLMREEAFEKILMRKV